MVRQKRRQAEYSKYEEAYKGVYGMGKARRLAAYSAIDTLDPGSLLDIGCGRGEILNYSRTMGFSPVRGVDVVPELFGDDVGFGEAHDLPFSDDEFDVVTCFDVLEHLLPEDTVDALGEISRVSKRAVVLCIANYPSFSNGHDLHINKRPYKEWDELIHAHMEGKVEWLPRYLRTHSETWIIDNKS